MKRHALDRVAAEPTEINLAPLIDMMFILLIFFMVSTTFVEPTGVSVRRPAAAASRRLARDVILVAVDASGAAYMAGRRVSLLALRGRVRRALGLRSRPVVIAADAAARAQAIVDVIDECRLAGAKDISLATRKER